MAIYEGKTANGRILRQTSVPARVEVTKDGTATDADVATQVRVTITRADGTAVATNQIVSQHPATGAYEWQLTTTDTASVDLLTAAWSITLDGTSETFTTSHEVVGAFLFTEAELRTFGDRALADATAFPDATIADARDRITDDFERICGASFVTRYGQRIRDGADAQVPLQGGFGGFWGTPLLGNVPTMLTLGCKRLQRMRAVSVDGTALSQGEVDAIHVFPEGYIIRDGGWNWGRRNIVLGFEHGWDRPPPELRRAAMVMARFELVSSDVGDRTISFSNDMGTFRQAVASAKFPTGIPFVDSVLERYSEHVWA